MKPAQKRLLSLKMTLANLLVNSKGISQRQALKLANGIANSGIDHLALCIANLRKIARLEKREVLQNNLMDITNKCNVLLNDRINTLQRQERNYLKELDRCNLIIGILTIIIVVLIGIASGLFLQNIGSL